MDIQNEEKVRQAHEEVKKIVRVVGDKVNRKKN